MTNPKFPIPKHVYRFGGRGDVAAILILAVLLLAALGSCFPQLPSLVAAGPEREARWEAAVRARYGALTDLLAAGGAFRWFRSPVFLVPLAVLLLGTTVSFNFPHCWVHARIKPEGTLRLAGRANRRAYGFGHEFAALVAEIKHAAVNR